MKEEEEERGQTCAVERVHVIRGKGGKMFVVEMDTCEKDEGERRGRTNVCGGEDAPRRMKW